MTKSIWVSIALLIIAFTPYSRAQVDSISVHRYVDSINVLIQQKGLNWRAGITSKSLLTRERRAKLCGLRLDSLSSINLFKQKDSLSQRSINLKNTKTLTLGPQINWLNYMSKIKDQDSCEGCWAFASTAVAIGLLQQYIGSVQGENGISLDEFYMANTATCGNCEGGGTWLCGLDYILNNKLRSEQGLNQFPN